MRGPSLLQRRLVDGLPTVCCGEVLGRRGSVAVELLVVDALWMRHGPDVEAGVYRRGGNSGRGFSRLLATCDGVREGDAARHEIDARRTIPVGAEEPPRPRPSRRAWSREDALIGEV